MCIFKNRRILAAVIALLLLGGAFGTDTFARHGARARHHRRVVRRHARLWVGFHFVIGAAVRLEPRYVVVAGPGKGAIEFSVRPKEAKVLVDGELRGTVDDFDGSPQYLYLPAGPHKITLRSPAEGEDMEEMSEKIHITEGAKIEIKLDLKKK